MKASSGITVHPCGGASLFRQYSYEAVLDSYEPGDAIGYGSTEEEAIQDLVEAMDARMDSIMTANVQTYFI